MMTAYRTWSHSYDAMGNPTSYHNGTRWNYQWNGRQLTQAVVKGASTPSSFTYDENGLRVGKSVVGSDGTTQHTYLYDSDGTLVREIREYPGGTQDIMEYMYDQNGRPYAFVLNNTIYYYVLNLQGDVVRIVNTSGTTVASYTYNAYGKLLSTATTSVSNSATVAEKNPIRYRGYYYDNDIKLYYCQSRYYDPIIGRFLNPDVYVITGQGILDSNMYGYCNNNPVCNYDPMGQELVPLSADRGVYVGGGYVGELGLLAGGLSLFADDIEELIQSLQVRVVTTAEKKYNHEYERHHIVARSSIKAKPARNIVRKVYPGEGTEVAINIVPISTNLHKVIHTDFYYALVNHHVVISYYNANGNPTLQMVNVNNTLSQFQIAIQIADVLWR